MTGEDLARLILLLIAGAVLVNIARGSFRLWLHNKFVGAPAGPGPSQLGPLA